MVRTSQGGSVLSFILIGTILTLLLTGGVYFLRQQTAQPVIGQSSGPENSDTSQLDKDKSNNKAKTDTSKKQDAKKSTADNSSDTTKSTGSLPQTGPKEDTVIAVGMLAVLSGLFLAYLRSRQPELSL